MSLLKRGSTYTSMVWVDGVRYSRALHTGNKRTAEKLDQIHKEELHQRQYQQPQFNPEMTFNEVFSRFLAEASVKAFHTERAKYFLGFFGDLRLGRITRNDAIRYRKLRHAEYVSRHKDKPRTLTESTVTATCRSFAGCSSGQPTRASSSTIPLPACRWCASAGVAVR